MIPVILAGGSGTRLWPMSRELYPKQLLAMTDAHTMLQHTLMRLDGIADLEPPVVLCNETYRYGIARQLWEIGIHGFELILETVGRNTAPAIAVAALKAMSRSADEQILVLPADHLIRDVVAFHEAVHTAAAFARQGYLTTFGVVPQSPETGYGYIRKGPATDAGEAKAFAISRFVEKPDLETAQQYLDSGQYCWNSGMFLFRAADIWEELKQLDPEMADACSLALENGRVDQDALFLDPGAFGRCRSDSIDYAVMEKTEKGVMVPLDAGWSDLGSWAAMWECGTGDENGNVCTGDVLVEKTKNSLVFAQSRLVAAAGIRDLVIVETADAVLVADRTRSQEVKSVVSGLKARNRSEAFLHPTRFLSWGVVIEIHTDAQCAIRRIEIDPEKSFEIISPADAACFWSLISGSGWMIRDQGREKMNQGFCGHIGPKQRLGVAACGQAPLVILETSVPAAGPDHLLG
ncbi:MAG: mannose-1-phosphate guanylyltransferase/mannose-6-phosphate isomerase [Desulfobacteraceae bacterium]|nr:mannose-1-phosphate guanylyltransferase/mannose-6-phosphate isomerase [Desulfobacteraceae bacterium]